MRVKCTVCKGKARIASREEYSPLVAKLYCACLDAVCGHTFVMMLSFSHTLRPAAGGVEQLLFDRLRELPLQQRRELFEKVDTPPDRI